MYDSGKPVRPALTLMPRELRELDRRAMLMLAELRELGSDCEPVLLLCAREPVEVDADSAFERADVGAEASRAEFVDANGFDGREIVDPTGVLRRRGIASCWDPRGAEGLNDESDFADAVEFVWLLARDSRDGIVGTGGSISSGTGGGAIDEIDALDPGCEGRKRADIDIEGVIEQFVLDLAVR